MPAIDEYDGFLVDLDGVVWVGRDPVPGSPEALATMLAAGKEIVFVTNNPSKPPDDYAERLRGMGVETGRSGSSPPGSSPRASPPRPPAGRRRAGARPRASAEAGRGRRAMADRDLDQPPDAAVVVVSGFRDFTYAHLLASKRALDAGAALVATSHDATMPMPGGEWPGTGAILAAVEVASGKKAEIAGKPEHHLFDLALSRIHGAKRVAMIGDRLSSDIAGGQGAGLDTILVLSGTSEDPTTAASSRP